MGRPSRIASSGRAHRPKPWSTLASARVKAQIPSPVGVSTNRPAPWRMPVEAMPKSSPWSGCLLATHHSLDHRIPLKID
jgi:hypothetical protein